jgi:DNA polymerase
MNDFDTLLDAAVREIESMKSAGVRHVNVSRDTLATLAKTAPRSAPSRPAVVPSREATSPVAVPIRPAGPVPAPAVTPAALATSAPPADKSAALAALRARALACVQCPHLVASRKQVVFGVGNPEARLMFVGEAPGADEDAQGEPFVGAAGQLLTKIIQAMGLARRDVFIANILKCRPDMPAGSSGNRKPTPEEMHTCSPWLLEQIDVIRPQVMVALGGVAVEGLLGKTAGITRVRGSWQTFRGTPLMPTFHPAYLLRNQALSEKRKVWEDMMAVMTRLGMPISETQRNYFLRAQAA